MPFAPAALSVFLAGSVAAGVPDEKMAEDLPPAAVETPNNTNSAKAEKRFSIARDVAGLFPVGDLANDTGPMGGPLTRLGFQATRHLEVGLRSGFLHGLDKETAYGSSAMSGVPILASVRWFAIDHHQGPYVGFEVGANVLRRRYDFDATVRARATSSNPLPEDRTQVYFGANVTLGVVVSRELPIDLRFQASALDLVGDGKPLNAIALGGTAGYTIYF